MDRRPPAPVSEPSRERGSVLPLFAVALSLCVFGILVLTGLTSRAIQRADAQTAADMAALAGVLEGESGAAELAERNGGRLVRFEPMSGDRVRVVVVVGGAEAEAFAELAWEYVPSEGP